MSSTRLVQVSPAVPAHRQGRRRWCTAAVAAALFAGAVAAAPILPGVDVASAQTFQWARAVASTGSDYGNAVAVDAPGNVYAAGMFTGTAQVGESTLTAAGDKDIYVAELAASGDVTWARSIGGTGYDSVHGVAVDTAGNLYIAGSFTGTVTFGATSLTAVGDQDGFVARLDAGTGDIDWATAMGGSLWDTAWRVAVHTGGVYAVGSFRGTATFGPFTLTEAGSVDGFVTRLDVGTGTVGWAVAISSTEYDHGHGVAVDPSGNVYTTGDFMGTAQLGTVTLTSAGQTDLFVAKHDPATGAVAWAVPIGGASFDSGESVAVDSSGAVYVTGHATPVSDPDVFVARLDAATGAVAWTRTFGVAGYDYGVGAAVDSAGDVYATGTFQGTVEFGAESLTALGAATVFVAKLGAATGDVVWARAMGGPDYDRAGDVAVDSAGSVYATGTFWGTASFGEASLTSAGADDAFVVKLGTATVVADWDTVTETIQELRLAVLDLGLVEARGGAGVEKGLLAKLDSALRSAGREDADKVVDAMVSFAEQVGALSGKRMTEADAAALIGMAEDVVEMVGAL